MALYLLGIKSAHNIEYVLCRYVYVLVLLILDLYLILITGNIHFIGNNYEHIIQYY